MNIRSCFMCPFVIAMSLWWWQISPHFFFSIYDGNTFVQFYFYDMFSICFQPVVLWGFLSEGINIVFSKQENVPLQRRQT